jgi:ppGpp synthetase/RelA/SpoT-type nucleotidyltranferase
MRKIEGDLTNLDLIQAFVAQYEREYDFYSEVAKLVAQRCEAITTENGIRGIVSSRAKSPERLEGKLNQRHPRKNYQSEDDIRADIVDLSGVRIALYFSSDRDRIKALIHDNFIVDRVKPFPETAAKHQNNRFDGYHGEHYLVRLDRAKLPEAQRRYGDSRVEIQVASVLMHAWSEVEHDLVYKPLSGQVSEEERAILDGINGIVLTGEVFLERLQAAFEARVSRKGNIFANQYELAGFLYDHLRDVMAASGPVEPVMGRADILFRLLQEAKLYRSEDLGAYLDNLDIDTERRPLADQVIDRILASNPNLYEIYLEIRRAVGASAPGDRSKGGYPSLEVVGSFLQKWIVLERFSRALLAAKAPSTRRISFPTTAILRRLELPEHLYRQFETLRRIRNNLVHGVVIPEEQLLSAADQELDDLIRELGSIEDPDVHEALRWAQSNEPDPLM